MKSEKNKNDYFFTRFVICNPSELGEKVFTIGGPLATIWLLIFIIKERRNMR